MGTAYYPGELEIAPVFRRVLFYQFDQLHITIFSAACCDVPYDFPHLNVHNTQYSAYTDLCCRGSCFIYVICNYSSLMFIMMNYMNSIFTSEDEGVIFFSQS